MNRLATILIPALLLIGCTRSAGPPWRLIELGEGPVAGQLETGWVRVESGSDSRWLLPDNGPEGLALLARDLRSLPEIACGDKVRLWPGDIPLSIRHAAGWTGTDSLTVRWQCFDQTGLAGLFLEAIQQDSALADQREAAWISMLQIHRPDTQRHDGVPLRIGEEVTLSISTRADGRPLEPETVTITFNMGDADQVVPAIEKELNRARSNSEWTAWATSADAFGEEAHPELGLPAHMPLRFSVLVE